MIRPGYPGRVFGLGLLMVGLGHISKIFLFRPCEGAYLGVYEKITHHAQENGDFLGMRGKKFCGAHMMGYFWAQERKSTVMPR